MTKLLLISVLLCISTLVFTQDGLQTPIDGNLDASTRIEEIRALNNKKPRELSVLLPTIAPEEIDRAVLNRLMQDINSRPEEVKMELAVSKLQLEDIFITISNARSSINNSEMANVRAMCKAWNDSGLEGDPRYEEALNAYKRRAQFTRDFIAKYYRIVLMDIESVLEGPSRVRFNSYMENRRRRIATSGATSWGAVVENVTSGRESVDFLCRRN